MWKTFGEAFGSALVTLGTVAIAQTSTGILDYALLDVKTGQILWQDQSSTQEGEGLIALKASEKIMKSLMKDLPPKIEVTQAVGTRSGE
jgi:hypothetical protein